MFSANSNQSGGVDATTDPYFNYTTLLLSGDGTNGAQNNTFVDASVNNATITRTGTTTQGSFSPFSQTGWSGYFNGSSWLTVPAGANFQFTGDYTLEAWIYVTDIAYGLIFGTANGGGQADQFGYSPTGEFYFANAVTATGLITTNNWIHVAASRSGTTQKLFINGVVQSTATVTGTIGQNLPGYIGRRADTYSPVTGYISNLRIVKGVAVYTGNFTPPTTPLTATQAAGTNIAAITGTATSLLTLQSNRFKDNSTNNVVVSPAGTPSIQAFSPLAPTAAYSLPAAAAGSAYFNGANTSRLNIIAPSGPTSSFNFGSANFTIEFWSYYNTNTATVQFSISNNDLLYISRNTNTTMSFMVRSYEESTDTYYYNAGTSTLLAPINAWHHIALVSVSSVYKLYVNGILYVSVAGTVGALVDAASTGIGIGGTFGINVGQTNGYMSNVRVVKGTAVYTGAFTPLGAPLTKIQSAGSNITALSGTETSLLTLQDSTFKDNSNYTNAITAYGAPVIQSFTPFTQVWGGYFDGSSQLICANNAAFAFFTSNFTVECWLYPLSSGGQSVMNYSNGQAAAQNFAWEMYQINGTTIQFGIYDSDGATGANASSTGLLINTWNHIAAVRNGNTLSIYVNGVVGGTTASVTGVSVFNKSSATLKVSGYNNATYQYTGYLSNLRITKGVAVYTGAFTPPAKTLSATQAAGVNISAITGTATSLLTLQDPTFKDNAILPNTITATGSPKAQLLSAPFTSAATVDPVSGSGYFNGSSYLSVPSNAVFGFGTGDFTVEGWFYFTGTISTYQRPWWFGDDNDNLEINSSVIRYGGASLTVITGSTALANTWYHIAYSRQSGSGKLFINGTQVGSTTANSYNSAARTFTLMATSSGANPSTGYVSNFRIVKGTAVYTAAFQPPSAPLTAITNTSLLTLQDTTFKDNSANALAITATGTPVMRAFTPFASNWGGLFAGTSTYLTPSNIPIASTGAFTIEFWMYSTSSALQCIYSQYLSAGVDPGRMNVLFNDPTGKIVISTGTSVGTGSLTTTSSISLNIWTHFAIVRDSSNVAKMYINGVLDATNATFTSTIMQTPAYIGYTSASPGYGFNGYLSNFRITNTAVYTANFTPPSAPLTAITNTSLLTLQNSTFIDNSANAFAITATGSPKTQLLDLPFTSSITKVAAPWNISVTAPLATVGGSMYFTTDYLSITNSNLAFGTSAFTVEFWINPNSFSDYQYIIDTRGAGGDASGFAIYSPATGLLVVAIGNAGTISASTALTKNIWQHIAVSSTGTSVTLYLNGSSIGSGSYSTNIVDTTMRIATWYAVNAYYFNGYISNFRVVKGTAVYTGNFTVPTAPPQPNQTPGLLGTNINAVDGTNTSLLLLGSNAGIYDATAKNDLVTVGNAQVSSTQIKYGTGAMYFDGTGDYLTLPSSATTAFGTGDFNVECWVYMTANSSYRMLLGNGSSYLCFINGTPNAFYSGVSISSTGTVSLNTWAHVAFVRSSGTMYFYINGVLSGSGAFAGTWGAVGVSNIGVSADYAGLYYFTGYIDDLRITKYARYTAAFTPPTKAMIGQ